MDHVAQVERVDVVGREDEDEVGTKVADEAARAQDGVGVALVPARVRVALVGRQNLQAAVRAVQVPGAAVGEVVVERVRLELLDDPHVRDARVHAVGKREVNQAIRSGKRQRGLSAPPRQLLHSVALAAGQNQRQNSRVLHPCSFSTRARFAACGSQ
jgi:hypothetical protein